MHYQRNLPHIMPPGATLFVTFRLAGSLPLAVVEQLQKEYAQPLHFQEDPDQTHARQRRYFGVFDQLLDTGGGGPTWLRQAAVAQVVAEALHFRHGRDYTLWAYCIMANHVHLLVSPIGADGQRFYRVLQSLKARTARRCNELIGGTGDAFWQPESYDHYVRNTAEMDRIIAYVLNNPVKAGLVDDWTQWPHTYLNPDW
ncbi:transposase [Hymenobacter caeli]|uniref:REP element-mobilizing transposase RayT n=1 Tax=Hymenobacter caeli TaxID=2735894 RepID=A0ABX2FP31_9BACT|nr:transposase [Hymenobacter caeli]NRT18943.1 REP element-mobilizing transposase RayT [Hymenobacter caeli]